jgi:RND family efflux transporter MFP subunit
MTNRLLVLLALLLAAPTIRAGVAQEVPGRPDSIGEFDCVIEPKLMIKLGNTETGIVQAVNVDRNQTVKKGEIVAALDSELQRIALDLAQIKAGNLTDIQSESARLLYRTTEANRASSLFDRGTGSAKNRDEAVTEKDLAELALAKAKLENGMAALEVQQAQARLDRRFIRSPVDGVVADVTIKPGEYAYEQAPLMTIAELDPLYVKVFVPVRHYRQLHVGSIGEVMPEAPIGGMYRAQVTVVDRVFDAASSTFGLRLELANPDYTLPGGLRCRVRFLAGEAAASK